MCKGKLRRGVVRNELIEIDPKISIIKKCFLENFIHIFLFSNIFVTFVPELLSKAAMTMYWWAEDVLA